MLLLFVEWADGGTQIHQAQYTHHETQFNNGISAIGIADKFLMYNNSVLKAAYTLEAGRSQWYV